MKIPKNGKLYYGLAGASLVVAAGLLYLQKSSLDDLGEQAAQLRETSLKEKGARANLVIEKKNLTDLQAKLAHLEQGIPDAAYVPTMLRELEVLGKNDNVEVAGLRPAAKKNDLNLKSDKKNIDTKPYEPLDLELKGKATYSDLLKFLSALNTFPKILEVRTVTVAPSNGSRDNSDNRLEITMGIRAFLFKQPSQPKKDGVSA